MKSSSNFDEAYFERGLATGTSCYTNYRWIPELTIPMCYQMIRHLKIQEADTILDFGCAKGYVVKAFRLLGHEAYGVDISEYAVSQAPEDVKKFVYLIKDIRDVPRLCHISASFTERSEPKKFTWCIAKDVLEHVNHDEIQNVLMLLKSVANNIFIIVPLGDGQRFIVPSYELDVTHQIKESLEWWTHQVKAVGLHVLKTSYQLPRIKENYQQWNQGNAFIVLSSNEPAKD